MTSHRSDRASCRKLVAGSGPRGRRALISLPLLIGLLLGAWPTFAAEIVEVRIGRHPTYTRVVFELDRPAGYRIERSDPATGQAELIISIEASSIPRSLTSQKSFIDRLEVEPRGNRSVARLRLTKGGLRLTEMILASPPRIVLDLAPEPPPAPLAQPKLPAKGPRPTSAVVEREDPSFEAVVAQIEPSSPRPTKEQAASAATESGARPTPDATPGPVAEVEKPASAPSDPRAPARPARLDPPAPPARADRDQSAAAQPIVADEPSTSVPIQPDKAVGKDAPVERPVQRKAPSPARAPEPAPQPRSPMVAKSTTPAAQGDGWRTWALIGAAALIVLGGGLFVARRRSEAASEGDPVDWDGSAGDGDSMTFEETNPFAVVDEPTTAVEPVEDESAAAEVYEGETTAISIPGEDDDTQSDSLFGEAVENDMDDLELISGETADDGLGGPVMPPVLGGGAEEMQQMFAEMTRRLEALEARCDALVDARDRLERQVAAQTEELRVQRAAIARTQRAVRNLGRGETEGDEPTEPALRDPNR